VSGDASDSYLSVLAGCLIRVRAPFRDPRIPLYCAARVHRLSGAGIEIELLHTETKRVLRDKRRVVSIDDVSNQELDDDERREAWLAAVDADSPCSTPTISTSRRAAAVVSAKSTPRFRAQLVELRRPRGYGARAPIPTKTSAAALVYPPTPIPR